MLDLLTSVVREGTGKTARIEVPSAGKTGTSQDYRDAWFVGFTPNIIVGVWVGNDDNSPMRGVTGGSIPAAIWRDIVTQAGACSAEGTGSPASLCGARPPLRGPAPVMTGQPETTGSSPAGPPPLNPPAADAVLRGTARVLDTGTLEIRGQVVRLEGVEGIGGRIAHALGRVLRHREVMCEPAGTAHRCTIGPIDVSQLVIANGGGRASADASPELKEAEEQARLSRRGIWGER